MVRSHSPPEEMTTAHRLRGVRRAKYELLFGDHQLHEVVAVVVERTADGSPRDRRDIPSGDPTRNEGRTGADDGRALPNLRDGHASMLRAIDTEGVPSVCSGEECVRYGSSRCAGVVSECRERRRPLSPGDGSHAHSAVLRRNLLQLDVRDLVQLRDLGEGAVP